MQLLQSIYFEIAAVVIAVLLVVLLVLLIRRRHATTSAEVRSGFGVNQSAGTAAPLPSALADEPAPSPKPTDETPASAATPWQGPTPTPALAADPLVATLASMIARPDRLTEADFRRLAIYRPDRVLAAIYSLTPVVGSDKHAAVKLEKLAAIRSFLEEPPTEAASPQAPVSEPAAPEPEGSAAETTPTEGDTESADASARVPLNHVDSPGESESIPETVEPLECSGVDEHSDPRHQAVEAAPSQGAELRETLHALTEPQETEVEIEENPVEMEVEVPPQLVAEIGEQEASPSAAAEMADQRQEPGPAVAEQFHQSTESDSASVLQRLSAEELGTALRSSGDESEQRQIIDRLVELGTGEALLALDEFLGSADSSDVQLYALSAAERFLGGPPA